jgi:hypothetical protein
MQADANITRDKRKTTDKSDEELRDTSETGATN